MVPSLLLVALYFGSLSIASALPSSRPSVAHAQHRQRPLFVAASPIRQDTSSDDWRQQMLYILNDIRRKAGRPAIARSPAVDKMAQGHSDYQASINQMTHDDAGGSLGQRATQAGIPWSGVGENVAFGSHAVEDTMDMWLDSPLHYANMIGDYALVGFGRALNSTRSSNDIYWTQEFIRPRNL